MSASFALGPKLFISPSTDHQECPWLFLRRSGPTHTSEETKKVSSEDLIERCTYLHRTVDPVHSHQLTTTTQLHNGPPARRPLTWDSHQRTFGDKRDHENRSEPFSVHIRLSPWGHQMTLFFQYGDIAREAQDLFASHFFLRRLRPLLPLPQTLQHRIPNPLNHGQRYCTCSTVPFTLRQSRHTFLSDQPVSF